MLMMKRVISAVLIIMLALTSVLPVSANNSETLYLDNTTKYINAEHDKYPIYTDVEYDDWFAYYVGKIYNLGIMTGTKEVEKEWQIDVTFSPYQVMTRAMFVTTLGRMAKVDTDEYQGETFSDVKPGSYYAPYVSWAVENGIVAGFTPQQFRPNANVTREQAVLMLARYAEAFGLEFETVDKDVPRFSDIENTTDEFKEEYLKVYAASIIEGKTPTTFVPKAGLTRAECAKILTYANGMFYEKETVENAFDITIKLPWYWYGRYTPFGWLHPSIDIWDGLPGEPGFFGWKFWESTNHKRDENQGNLFSFYLLDERGKDILLFQNADGTWKDGVTALYRVRLYNYGEPVELTLILEKPTELQYNPNDFASKKNYERLAQDIDEVVASFRFPEGTEIL